MFNGMVGQLQREEADFTTVIGPSPPRLKVVDFLQSYPSDKMTLASLQPSFLPKHLTFIKPFTGIVWLCTLCGIMFWGITYWMLHTLKILRVEGRKVELSNSLLYSIGAIVEEACPDPSYTTTGQHYQACGNDGGYDSGGQLAVGN
ncbi:hypothetical protein O3P69_004658 [Scylla paramamosain]|uniref:Uncharacterized protein n=1 Tax=Scylla paramamosain TaxID=85552 RepID=A0AAW0UAP9_SCYPA